jgi:hypothetical protein
MLEAIIILCLILIVSLMLLYKYYNEAQSKSKKLESSKLDSISNDREEKEKRNLDTRIQLTRIRIKYNDRGDIKEVLEVESDLPLASKKEAEYQEDEVDSLDDSYNISEYVCEYDQEGKFVKDYTFVGEELVSTTIVSYDKKGNAIKEIGYDDKGQYDYQAISKYDDKNRLERVDRYNSREELRDSEFYIYNESNQLIENQIEFFYVLHNESRKMVHKLDRYKEDDLYIPPNDKQYFTYDTYGNVIEKKYYEAFNVELESQRLALGMSPSHPKSTIVYKYDDNSKLIEQVQYSVYGKRILYDYDNNGREVLKITIDNYLGSSISIEMTTHIEA